MKTLCPCQDFVCWHLDLEQRRSSNHSAHRTPWGASAKCKKEKNKKKGKKKKKKACRSIVEEVIGRPAQRTTSMQSVVSQYRLHLKNPCRSYTRERLFALRYNPINVSCTTLHKWRHPVNSSDLPPSRPSLMNAVIAEAGSKFYTVPLSTEPKPGFQDNHMSHFSYQGSRFGPLSIATPFARL